MPHRRIINRALGKPPGPAKRPDFRRRYDQLEGLRAELLERLARYGERGRTHPSYRRAETLLNETFRKSTITQRASVLQAAAWLVALIENSLGLI